MPGRCIQYITKYNQNDQIKYDEMDGASSMHGEILYMGFQWESQKERDH
jgi:hypothetical protein